MSNTQASNTGHGHVRPRPDGVKARCGGPAMCSVCQQEAGALMANGLTEAETVATASVVGLTGAWQPAPVPLQGGLENDALRAAWDKKLPGVVPTDRELSAFALGVEAGFEHARNLERQDWSRVHHVLAKHSKHPGRTDDHLADVIDRALSAT